MSQNDFQVQWNDLSPKVEERKKRKRKIFKKKLDKTKNRSPCFTSVKQLVSLGEPSSEKALQTPPLFKRMKLPHLETPSSLEKLNIIESKSSDFSSTNSPIQNPSTSAVEKRCDPQGWSTTKSTSGDSQENSSRLRKSTEDSFNDDSFFERSSFLAASQAVLDEITKNSTTKFTPTKKPEHHRESPDVHFIKPIVASTPLTVCRSSGRMANSKLAKHKLKMDDSGGDSQALVAAAVVRASVAAINDSDDFCINVDLEAIIGPKKIH